MNMTSKLQIVFSLTFILFLCCGCQTQSEPPLNEQELQSKLRQYSNPAILSVDEAVDFLQKQLQRHNQKQAAAAPRPGIFVLDIDFIRTDASPEVRKRAQIAAGKLRAGCEKLLSAANLRVPETDDKNIITLQMRLTVSSGKAESNYLEVQVVNSRRQSEWWTLLELKN